MDEPETGSQSGPKAPDPLEAPPVEPKDKRRVETLALRGVFWQSFMGGYIAVAGFGVFMVLARLLEPREFGLVSVAALAMDFIRLIRMDGLEAAAVQKESVTDEHLDALFAVNMIQGVAFAIVTIIAAPWAAWFFDTPEATSMIRWMAPAFVLDALTGVPSAILQRRLDFKALAIRRVVAYTVGAIIGVGAAYEGFGSYSLIMKQLTGSLAGVLTLWSTAPRRPRLVFSWDHFKELFSFGIYVKGSTAIQFIGQRGDEFVVGALMGPESLGFYTTARRILRVIGDVLTRGIAKVALPALARLQHDVKRMSDAVKGAVQISTVVVVPIYALLIVLAPEAIRVAVGARWLESADVLRFMTPVQIVGSAEFIHGGVVVARGKPQWQMWLQAARSTLYVAGAAIGSLYGPTGVALGYSIARVVIFPASLTMVMKLIPLGKAEYYRILLPGFGSSIVMVLVAVALRLGLNAMHMPAFVTLAVTGVVSIVVYAVTLRVVNPAVLTRVGRTLMRTLPGGVSRRIVRVFPSLAPMAR